jgi:adenosine deaminase
VREVVLDAAAAGVVYLEPQLYPPLHEQHFGCAQRVVEIVLDELATVGAATGVATGLMLVADRASPVEVGQQQARLATRYAGQGVVAFGLVGDEQTGPASQHATTFTAAKQAGLLCVPHAGELAGPDSVRAALTALRADRLGHGIRAIEDPALLDQLADEQIVLDVCPTSNLRMGTCTSLDAHPLPTLLAAGIPCSLNTDDSLLFGCDLLGEYRL